MVFFVSQSSKFFCKGEIGMTDYIVAHEWFYLKQCHITALIFCLDDINIIDAVACFLHT